MRVNRAKFIRKYLRFFKVVYGIDAPYNVILDGNFIFQGIKHKIDMEERLGKLLQGAEVRIYVQRSILKELETIGEKATASLEWARKFCEIIEDNDFEGDLPSNKLRTMIDALKHEKLEAGRRRKHYIVATQDKDLRSALGSLPGVPLIYLNKVTLVLERPSDASKNKSMEMEVSKESLSTSESDIVSTVKLTKGVTVIGSDDSVTTASTASKERRKRKATSANPLSSLAPTKDSANTKRRKIDKFKRKKGGPRL